jgi:hypothetical protein
MVVDFLRFDLGEERRGALQFLNEKNICVANGRGFMSVFFPSNMEHGCLGHGSATDGFQTFLVREKSSFKP